MEMDANARTAPAKLVFIAAKRRRLAGTLTPSFWSPGRGISGSVQVL